MGTITVATDKMCADLRAELDRDFGDLGDDELWAKRDEVASHYMLYAVKPLSPNSDHRPHAEAIRAERTDLLRRLWLHIDALCATR
jgi:hypothetical protein